MRIYQRQRSFFKDLPEQIEIYPTLYLSSLNNFCLFTAEYNDHKSLTEELLQQFEESFSLLGSYFSKHNDMLTLYRKCFTSNKLIYVRTHHQWQLLDELEKQTKDFLEKSPANEKVNLALQTLMLVSCHYYIGNYARTLDWVNIYYTLDAGKKVRAMMICARVFEVFALHRSDQFDLSDNRAVNLYKTLIENKFDDPYYKHLGTLLRKLNKWNVKNKADRTEIEKLILEFNKLRDGGNGQFNVYDNHFEPQDILLPLLKGKK